MNNFSIRKKLILLSTIVLLVIFAYSMKISLDSYSSYSNDTQTQNIIELSVKISSVLHELQKERGASAGFIGSKGEKFADILPKQQANTDIKIAELKAYCEVCPLTEVGMVKKQIDLESVKAIRVKVNAQNISVKD